jgi:hypothetical protein
MRTGVAFHRAVSGDLSVGAEQVSRQMSSYLRVVVITFEDFNLLMVEKVTLATGALKDGLWIDGKHCSLPAFLN